MSPISIAIAGIGNVGQEVVAQLLKSKEYSKKFVIGGISYKNKKKQRSIDLSNFNFVSRIILFLDIIFSTLWKSFLTDTKNYI